MLLCSPSQNETPGLPSQPTKIYTSPTSLWPASSPATMTTGTIARPRLSRTSRTRSLPQVLSSISEEHGDSDHGHATSFSSFAAPNSAATVTSAQIQLRWSTFNPSHPPSDAPSHGSIAYGERNVRNKVQLRIRTSPRSTKPNAFSNRFNDRDCGICFDSAVRPSRTKCCGKIFCEEHLHDWLYGSSNHCPACASKCYLATDTISLAPPMTPTVHNTPSGSSSTAPHLRIPPLRIPSPIHPYSLRPLPLAEFSNSHLNEPESASQTPSSFHTSLLDSTTQDQRPTPSQNSSSATRSSGPRSASLLPMLNAVSHALTRGFSSRRETNEGAAYGSPASTSDRDGIQRLPNSSYLPHSLEISFTKWSPLWPETPLWPQTPGFTLPLMSYYFSLDSLFNFDFQHDSSHSLPVNPASNTIPAPAPTGVGADGTQSNSDRPSSPFPSYRAYSLNFGRRPIRGDDEAQEVLEIGIKMLARVLSMVGMLLVLHALCLGSSLEGLGLQRQHG
ncbi:hypothetical protein C8R42DRAFT_726125 [Lentinula raphanica]|nr:hypothetical protein C8R42DRAFT_726125 [Lentinula raphanica]